MHCIILASMATLPIDSFANKQKTTILPFMEFVYSEVIDKKKVFASATTEPKIGARYSKTKTTYESTSRGYIINGTKSFVSMAEYADYYSIIANKLLKNGEPQKEHTLSFFIVPKNSPGLSIEKNWDTLGLRGTQSQMVHFKDTPIPQQYVFMGMTGFALSSVFKSPNWIIGGYMGAYLGIMKAALETTIVFIKNRTKTESGLGRSPLIQARLSDMYTLYQQTKLAIEHCARLVDKDPLDLATHRSVYHAKFVVGENAAALTSLAIKTCGGAVQSKNHSIWRDIIETQDVRH